MTIKFTVPENFSEVTVKHHRAIMDAWENHEEKSGKIAAVIGAICGIETKYAEKLGMETINEVVRTVAWMRTTPNMSDYPLRKFIEFDGVEYGVINNFSNLTLGEYVDLEGHAEKGFYSGMAEVLAILYRPIVTKTMNQYTILPYEASQERGKIMEQCPMDVAIGAMVFFWNIAKRLSIATLQSSAAMKVVQFPRSGDGTLSSIISQEET